MENKHPKIFILCGKAQAGKDTTAKFIKNEYLKRGKKVLNIQYSNYIKEYAKQISGWDGSEDNKPRELLQVLGTDIIRTKFGSYYFVDRLIQDINVYSFFFDVITISDGRFKIEVDTPKEVFDNVYAVRIDRPNFDNGLTEEEKKHPTEVDLDDYEKFNFKIINDSSLEELNTVAINLVKEVEHES